MFDNFRAAAGGAVAGAITAAVPTVGIASVLAIGAVSNVAAGLTERAVASGGKDLGTLTDVAVDAGVGAATAGVFKGASSVVKRLRPGKPPGRIRVLDSEETFQKQYGQLREQAACPCFAAETIVATAEGPKPIAEIRVGDLVLARDPDSGQTAYKPVTTVFVTPGKSLVELRVLSKDGRVETIHATPGHPFWVDGRGWTDAAELALGDLVTTSASGASELVAARSMPQVRTVYNLEVAEFHTYFVGTAELWVHNACNCGGGGAAAAGMWTATKNKTAAQNAFRHFKDDGADFGARNAVDYVKQAQQFLRSPPPGTLTRVRANGDVVRYNPGTNTFGVMDASGAPRTLFKPDPAVHGYGTNLEYFNAQ